MLEKYGSVPGWGITGWAAMKEQYVGDENDYRKYALLRHLAVAGSARIGVCWMLTPPDDRTDGGKISYLDQPEAWQSHEPEVFDLLRSARGSQGMRRLRLIERSGIIPGALFFTEHLSDRVDLRRAYFAAALDELKPSELIFFDPDNGLDVKSTPRGRAGSSKFIFRKEIKETYRRGHSVLTYQHFPRQKRDQFIGQLAHDLLAHAPLARLWCFRTPQVAFLLLVHPEHARTLGKAADAAASRWGAAFLTGAPLVGPAPE